MTKIPLDDSDHSGMLAVLGGSAISAPDKYSVQVPGGLSFSEFKGYEDWQSVSVSKTDHAFALILANPTMIDAYRAGIPGNGKPFPDGSKMAKIHWKPEATRRRPIRRRQCRAPGKRRLHGEGRQEVRGQRRMGMGRVQL